MSPSPVLHCVTPSEHGVLLPGPNILPTVGREGPGSCMWPRSPLVYCSLSQLAPEMLDYLSCSARPHGPFLRVLLVPPTHVIHIGHMAIPPLGHI